MRPSAGTNRVALCAAHAPAFRAPVIHDTTAWQLPTLVGIAMVTFASPNEVEWSPVRYRSVFTRHVEMGMCGARADPFLLRA